MLDLVKTVIIVLGVVSLATVISGIFYSAYMARLKAKQGGSYELEALQARVRKLESQLAGKKVPERLSVLEEIVTSEEFDLKRKLKDIEKVV